MIEIPHLSGEGLRCAATECDGSPWHGSGWHHVQGCDPTADQRHSIVVSVFVCSDHLAEAEQAMTEHVRDHATRAWTVETYRMHGWTDDGRGPVYTVASGDPTEQLPLF